VQLTFARPAGFAGAALAAAVLAGCGGPETAARPPLVTDNQWIANVSGVIDQLNGDVSAAAVAGKGVAAARRALHDESDLYGLLIAYSDFGGCARMVAGVGNPPPGFGRVQSALDEACGRFQRAAVLFTWATSETDAHALLGASGQVKLAQAALYRASLRLAAARTARSAS
jgi:hypothetical protein